MVDQQAGKAVLELEGRIDSGNAPAVLQQFMEAAGQFTEITLDLALLEYVSSAGLRALLTLYKTMEKKNGELIFTNVSEGVYEVLELTGFTALMTIRD